jgi:hypothetical protein
VLVLALCLFGSDVCSCSDLHARRPNAEHGRGDGQLFWTTYEGLCSTPLPVTSQPVVRVTQPLQGVGPVLYNPQLLGRLLVSNFQMWTEVDTLTGLLSDDAYELRGVDLDACADARGGLWSIVKPSLVERYDWHMRTVTVRLHMTEAKEGQRYADAETAADATTRQSADEMFPAVDPAGQRLFFQDYDAANKQWVIRMIDFRNGTTARDAVSSITCSLTPVRCGCSLAAFPAPLWVCGDAGGTRVSN